MINKFNKVDLNHASPCKCGKTFPTTFWRVFWLIITNCLKIWIRIMYSKIKPVWLLLFILLSCDLWLWANTLTVIITHYGYMCALQVNNILLCDADAYNEIILTNKSTPLFSLRIFITWIPQWCDFGYHLNWL